MTIYGFKIFLNSTNPYWFFFVPALLSDGLDKNYPEVEQKGIREYTDFWGGKTRIFCFDQKPAMNHDA